MPLKILLKKMKKYEYRCNNCLLILEKMVLDSIKPLNSIPCQMCGGLALKLPWSESKDRIFDDFAKKPDKPF